jgi:predicted transcriptional regulator
MARWDRFTFRVNSQDKQLVALLAERLQRSRSDAIRYVIRQVVNGLINSSIDQEDLVLGKIKQYRVKKEK